MNGRLLGALGIGVNLDLSNFESSVTASRRVIRLLDSELRANASAYGKVEESSNALGKRLDSLRDKFKIQERIVSENKKSLDELNRTQKEGSKAVQDATIRYNNSVNALNKFSNEIRGTENALDDLNSDFTELSKVMRVMESDFKVNESAMSNASKTTESLGKNLTDLEKMYKVQEQIVGELSEKYKQLSAEFGETSNEAVTAYEAMNDQVVVLNNLEGEIGEVTDELEYMESELNDLTKTMRVLESEYKVNQSAMENMERSAESLTDRLGELSNMHEVQEKIVAELRGEYDRLAEEFGETSEEAITAYEAMNDQVVVLNELEGEVNSVTRELEEFERETARVAREMDEAQDEAYRLNKEFDDMNSFTSKASRGLDKFGNKADDLGKKLKTLSDGVGRVGSAMTRYVTAPATAAASSALMTGVQSMAFNQESEQAFGVLLGGKDEAEEFMEDIMTFAKTTPFAFPDLVSGYRKLVSFNVEAEDTHGIIEAITNSVAAMSGGAQEIESMTDVFAKIQSNGKITGEELNRLGDNGINALMILANQSGVSMEEMRKQISSGAIDSETAINGLVEGIMNGSDGINGATKPLGGSLDALKDTLTGAVDSMKGAWRRMSEEAVGEENFESLIGVIQRLTELIPRLIPILEPVIDKMVASFELVVDVAERAVTWFEELDEPTKQLVTNFGLMAIAVGPVLGVLATLLGVLSVVASGVGVLSRGLKFVIDLFKKTPKDVSKTGGVFKTFGGILSSLAKPFKGLGKHVGKLAGGLRFLGKRAVMLLGPVGAVVGGLWLLYDVFKFAYDNSETFRKGVDKLWESIKAGYDWVVKFKDAFLGMWDGDVGYDGLANMFNIDEKTADRIFGPFFDRVDNLFKGLGFDLSDIFTEDGLSFDMDLMISEAKDKLDEFLKNPLSGIKYTPIGMTTLLLGDVAKGFGFDISEYIDLTGITDVTEGITEKFGEMKEDIVGFFEKIGETAEGIVDTVSEAKQWVDDLAEGIGKLFGGDTREEGLSILESLGINDELVKTMESIFGTMGDEFTKLKDKWNEFWEEEGPQIKEAIDNIVNFGDTIKETFEKAYTVVAEKSIEIYEDVAEGVTKAYGFAEEEISKLWGKISPHLDKVWAGIETGYEWTIEKLSGMWERLEPHIQPILDGAALLYDNVIGKIELAWTGAEEFLIKAKDKLVGAYDIAKEEIGKVLDKMSEKFEEAKAVIMPYVDDLKGGVTRAFDSIKEDIKSLIDGRLEELKNAIPNALEYVRERAEILLENIGGVFEGGMDILFGIVNIFTGLFTLDMEKMWEGVTRIWDGALGMISNLFDIATGTILDIAKRMKERVGEEFTKLKDSAIKAFGHLRDGVTDAVDRAREGVVDGFERARDGAVEFMVDTKEKVGDIFSDIVEMAKELPGKIGQGIKNMAYKAVDGIKSMGNSMAGKVGSVVNGVIDGINFTTGKLGVGGKIEPFPVPQFSRGTKGVHEGGLMTVGDHGIGNTSLGKTRELVKFPNGDARIVNKETTMYAPPGTEVLSNKDTEKLLRMQSISKYSRGTDGLLTRAMRTGKDILGGIRNGATDIWDAISDPSALLEGMLMKQLGKITGLSQASSDIARGGVNKFAEGALSFLNRKKDEATPKVSGNSLFPGYGINYDFGKYPFSFNNGNHYGQDYSHVNDPVKAPLGGKVTRNFWNEGGGRSLEIQTGKIYQLFMHLSKSLVGVGDVVKAGQTVAVSGNTGAWSSGAHLHYQTHRDPNNFNGTAFNPSKLLAGAGKYGFANGGVILDPGVYAKGENSPEAVIPLDGSSNQFKALAYVNHMVKNSGKRNKKTENLPDYRDSGDNGIMASMLSVVMESLEVAKEQLQLSKDENEMLKETLERELTVNLDGRKVSKEVKPHLDKMEGIQGSRNRRYGK